MQRSNRVRRSKTATIIYGVIMLLLGLCLVPIPGAPLGFVTISLLVGWAFVAAGITVIIAFCGEKKGERRGLDLLFAILSLIFGIWIVLFPALSFPAVVAILGAFVLCLGIADIVDSIELKDQIGGWWVLLLILGIITIMFGLSCLFVPFLFVSVMVIVAAITLIFNGITEIIAGIML